MQAGVGKCPEWFSPLTNSSSFEDFQRHLHGAVRFLACAQSLVLHEHQGFICRHGSRPGSCRTSVEGEEDYTKVQWAMQTGMVTYLSGSNPDQQLQLRGFPATPARRSLAHRRMPRALYSTSTRDFSANAGARVGKQSNVCRGRRVLHEGAVGDADGRDKVSSVVSPLTNSSSFEEFQRHLHNAARLSGVCPLEQHGHWRFQCQHDLQHREAAARLSRAKSATRR